jgi:hypothetical protein
MKKNFTTPPNGAGMLTELTGLNLRSDVYPSKNIFQKRPIFIDNCRECQPFKHEKMNLKLNASGADEYGYSLTDSTAPETSGGGGGGFFSGLTLNDLITTGAGIYSTTQQSQQLQSAQEIERLKAQQAQADAIAAQAGARGQESMAATIKAYALPIAVAGVVIVGGIAAYFMFRKKSS